MTSLICILSHTIFECSNSRLKLGLVTWSDNICKWGLATRKCPSFFSQMTLKIYTVYKNDPKAVCHILLSRLTHTYTHRLPAIIITPQMTATATSLPPFAPSHIQSNKASLLPCAWPILPSLPLFPAYLCMLFPFPVNRNTPHLTATPCTLYSDCPTALQRATHTPQ